VRALLFVALASTFCGTGQSAPQTPTSPPGQPARDRPGVTDTAGHGRIRGRVTDATTGEGVPRALVRLDGATPLATYTPADGSFEFGDLPAGAYYLTVSRAGYLANTGRGIGRSSAAANTRPGK
jgi:hypothetical protein